MTHSWLGLKLTWYILHGSLDIKITLKCPAWLSFEVSLIWSTQFTGLQGHLDMFCTVDWILRSHRSCMVDWTLRSLQYDLLSWPGLKVTLHGWLGISVTWYDVPHSDWWFYLQKNKLASLWRCAFLGWKQSHVRLGRLFWAWSGRCLWETHFVPENLKCIAADGGNERNWYF